MRLNLGAVLHVTHAYVGAMVDAGWGRDRHDRLRRGPQGRAHARRSTARPRPGAMGFMRGLAAEVGAHGVTANCVVARHDEDRRSPPRRSTQRSRRSSSKLARPYPVPAARRARATVAPLVALLCSDAARLDHRPGVSRSTAATSPAL